MTAETESLRVLIVTDDTASGKELKCIVGSQRDFEIAGLKPFRDRLLLDVALLRADVLVLDLAQHTDDGPAWVRALRAEYPDVHVVAASDATAPEFAEDILRAGALGYLSTSEGLDELPDAIRSVFDGQAFVSRRMSAKLLSKMMRATINGHVRNSFSARNGSGSAQC